MSFTEGLRTFTANGALAQGERVVITAGSTTTPVQVAQAPVGAAGVLTNHIGYVEVGVATGELVTVRLKSQGGTKEAVASNAIAVGAAVYGSALGRVATTAAGTVIGVAVEASTAAGDIIEIVEF